MSKIFGMILLLGLALMVLVSIGLLLFEWVNSSNDATPTPSPKSGSVVLYYQPPALDYGLTDNRQRL